MSSNGLLKVFELGALEIVEGPSGCRAGTYVLRIDAAEHRWAVPVMKMGE